VDTEEGRELALEFGIEAPGCKPEIKRGVHCIANFLGSENLAGWRDDGFARNKGARRMTLSGVLGDQLENLLA
jgi:hypothetical protein